MQERLPNSTFWCIRKKSLQLSWFKRLHLLFKNILNQGKTMFISFCAKYHVCTPLVLLQNLYAAARLDSLNDWSRDGSSGRVQGVCTPPPWDVLQFSNTTGILQKKKTMWFIGVEVEQETSAAPPKKNPGSAPVETITVAFDVKIFQNIFLLF